MAMFSAMAEDERGRITKRTHEGRKNAPGPGREDGPQKKLNELQKAERPGVWPPVKYQMTWRPCMVSVGQRSRGCDE